MPKKPTHLARAERWYAQQVKNGKLRDADYSALTRRMPLCYEPAIMMSRRNEETLQDILQKAKQARKIQTFKLD